jgi:uncharacterized protein
MLDGIPIIDAVVHPYNFDAANFNLGEFSRGQARALMAEAAYKSPRGYKLPLETYMRDWSIEEVANISFLESRTDLAVYHVLPIGTFRDGLCSLEKGVEALGRWPDRFLFYCAVDPLRGSAAIEELERQVEALKNPVGLKLYPNSWVGSEVDGWYMDDPEVAFPVFERARQLGIKTVAIHKALPLGAVPMSHYKVEDVDRAAIAFPDLNFEIVHGGMAFLEETAWQLMRFPNVYANLETTATMLTSRPVAFHAAMVQLLGNPLLRSKVVWGTGSMVTHPRPHQERFIREFRFSDELVEQIGFEQITEQEKRMVLADNYARMNGVDLQERLARIRGDEFDQRVDRDAERAEPYSTTKSAGLTS